MSILKNINQKYHHNFENKSKFGLSKILHCLMSINSLQYNNIQILLFCLCNGNTNLFSICFFTFSMLFSTQFYIFIIIITFIMII